MPSLDLLLGTMLLRTKGGLEMELEYLRSLLKAQSSLVVVNAAFDLSRHQLTLLNKENEVGCPENAANQIKKISVLVARGVTQAKFKDQRFRTRSVLGDEYEAREMGRACPRWHIRRSHERRNVVNATDSITTA